MTKRKYEKPDVKVEPYTGWELIGGCSSFGTNLGSEDPACTMTFSCEWWDLSV